jgi:hypothetical protein
VSVAARSATRRAPAPGRSADFGRVADPPIEFVLECWTVEAELDPRADVCGRGVVREKAASEGNRERHGNTQLVIESANEGDVMDALERDSARNALPRVLDSWHIEVGEEIIDPFRIGSSCMSSYFKVIESRHIILERQDK